MSCAAQKVDDDRDDRQDEKNVNQPPGNVEDDEAENPREKQQKEENQE